MSSWVSKVVARKAKRSEGSSSFAPGFVDSPATSEKASVDSIETDRSNDSINTTSSVRSVDPALIEQLWQEYIDADEQNKDVVLDKVVTSFHQVYGSRKADPQSFRDYGKFVFASSKRLAQALLGLLPLRSTEVTYGGKTANELLTYLTGPGFNYVGVAEIGAKTSVGLDAMSKSRLPSTLMFALAHIISRLAVRRGNFSNDLSVVRNEGLAVAESLFSTLCDMCKSALSVDELTQSDGLEPFIHVMSLFRHVDGDQWRNRMITLFDTLIDARVGHDTTLIDHLHAKRTVPLMLDMIRAEFSNGARVVSLIKILLKLLKYSCKLSASLLLDMTDSKGYEVLGDYLASSSTDSSSEDQSNVPQSNTVDEDTDPRRPFQLSIVKEVELFVYVGTKDLTFRTKKSASGQDELVSISAAEFSTPQMSMPADKRTADVTMRNIQAFLTLQSAFLRSKSFRVRERILEAMLTIFTINPINFFIIEDSHVLVPMLNQLEGLPFEIKRRVLELLQLIVFGINVSNKPLLEFGSLARLLQSRRVQPVTASLVLETISKFAGSDSSFQTILREVGLLAAVINLLEVFVASVSFIPSIGSAPVDSNSPPFSMATLKEFFLDATDGRFVAESSEPVANDKYPQLALIETYNRLCDCIVHFLDGNDASVSEFRNSFSHDICHLMYHPVTRQPALRLLSQLVEEDPQQQAQDVANATRFLRDRVPYESLATTSDLLITLRDSFRTVPMARESFRCAGGFHVLVQIVERVSKLAIFQELRVSSRVSPGSLTPVFNLLRAVFAVFTTALFDSTGNQAYCRDSYRFDALAEAIVHSGLLALPQWHPLYTDLVVSLTTGNVSAIVLHPPQPYQPDSAQSRVVGPFDNQNEFRRNVTSSVVISYSDGSPAQNPSRAPTSSANTPSSLSPSTATPRSYEEMAEVKYPEAVGPLLIRVAAASPPALEEMLLRRCATLTFSSINNRLAVAKSEQSALHLLQYYGTRICKIPSVHKPSYSAFLALLENVVSDRHGTTASSTNASIDVPVLKVSGEDGEVNSIHNSRASSAEDIKNTIIHNKLGLSMIGWNDNDEPTKWESHPCQQILTQLLQEILSTSVSPLTVRRLLNLMNFHQGVCLPQPTLSLHFLQLLQTAVIASRAPPFLRFDLRSSPISCVLIPSLAGGERSWPPATGYTFLAWIRIISFDTGPTPAHVQLLTVSDDAERSGLSININSTTNGLTVRVGQREIYEFTGFSFKERTWYHIAVVHTRQRNPTASTLSLYVDGLLATAPVRCSYLLPLEANAVALAWLGTRHQKSNLQWDLGPSYLIEEALDLARINAIFIVGPTYSGVFQGLVRKFMTYEALDTTNLEAIGNTSETNADPGHTVFSTALLNIPENRIVFAFHANHVWRPSVDLGSATSEYLLFDTNTPWSMSRAVDRCAVVRGGSTLVTCSGMSEALRQVGGVAVALKIIDLAQDQASLNASVDLIVHMIKFNWRQVLEMERINGYEILAHILLKKRDMLNISLIKSLLWLVGKAPDNKSDAVIANRTAYKHIFLNPEFWHGASLSIQKAFFIQLNDFCIKSDQNAFNIKRLIRLRIVRILLYILQHEIFAAELIKDMMVLMSIFIKTAHDEAQQVSMFLINTLHPSTTTRLALSLEKSATVTPTVPRSRGMSLSASRTQSDSATASTSTAPLASSINSPVLLSNSSMLHRLVENTRSGPSVNPAFGLIYIRNSLIIMLTQCLKDDSEGENSLMSAMLKTDADPLRWVLLHLAEGVHPHTVHLSLRLLVRLLVQRSGTMTRFRNMGGFAILKRTLQAQWHLAPLYPPLFALFFGTDVSNIPTDTILDLPTLLALLLPDPTRTRVFCSEALTIIFSMLRGIVDAVFDATVSKSALFATSATNDAPPRPVVDIPTDELNTILESLSSFQVMLINFIREMYIKSSEVRDLVAKSDFIEDFLNFCFPVIAAHSRPYLEAIGGPSAATNSAVTTNTSVAAMNTAAINTSGLDSPPSIASNPRRSRTTLRSMKAEANASAVGSTAPPTSGSPSSLARANPQRRRSLSLIPNPLSLLSSSMSSAPQTEVVDNTDVIDINNASEGEEDVEPSDFRSRSTSVADDLDKLDSDSPATGSGGEQYAWLPFDKFKQVSAIISDLPATMQDYLKRTLPCFQALTAFLEVLASDALFGTTAAAGGLPLTSAAAVNTSHSGGSTPSVLTRETSSSSSNTLSSANARSSLNILEALLDAVPNESRLDSLAFSTFFLARVAEILRLQLKMTDELFRSLGAALCRDANFLVDRVAQGLFPGGGPIMLTLVVDLLERHLAVEPVSVRSSLRMLLGGSGDTVAPVLQRALSRLVQHQLLPLSGASQPNGLLSALVRMHAVHTIMFAQIDLDSLRSVSYHLFQCVLLEYLPDIVARSMDLWRLMIRRRRSDLELVLKRARGKDYPGLIEGFDLLVQTGTDAFTSFVQKRRTELELVFSENTLKTWNNFVNNEQRLTADALLVSATRRTNRNRKRSKKEAGEQDLMEKFAKGLSWHAQAYKSEIRKAAQQTQNEAEHEAQVEARTMTILDSLMHDPEVWAPAGSLRQLTRWKLDFSEGPNRMRKKLVQNTLFYSHYPYRLHETEYGLLKQLGIDLRAVLEGSTSLPQPVAMLTGSDLAANQQDIRPATSAFSHEFFYLQLGLQVPPAALLKQLLLSTSDTRDFSAQAAASSSTVNPFDDDIPSNLPPLNVTTSLVDVKTHVDASAVPTSPTQMQTVASNSSINTFEETSVPTEAVKTRVMRHKRQESRSTSPLVWTPANDANAAEVAQNVMLQQRRTSLRRLNSEVGSVLIEETHEETDETNETNEAVTTPSPVVATNSEPSSPELKQATAISDADLPPPEPETDDFFDEPALESQVDLEMEEDLIPKRDQEDLTIPSEIDPTSTSTTVRPRDIEDRASKVMRELRALLEPNEKIEKVEIFNCARVVGLDVCEGLLILGKVQVYLVDNYFLMASGEIAPVWTVPPQLREFSLLTTAVAGGSVSSGHNTSHKGGISSHAGNEDEPSSDREGHPSRRWSIKEIREVHSRRFLLRDSAVEFFLVDGRSYLISLELRNRDTVYNRVLQRIKAFGSTMDQTFVGGTVPAVDTQLSLRLSSLFQGNSRLDELTERWQRRDISNFAYLMYLNTLAGRTYNDLTQYPVFPWILADYESDVLDLTQPSTFRDLSKPMGAQTHPRVQEFIERYEILDDPSLPPFHYGTHYSSAMATCSFLIRLEPFTQEYLKVQGCFDHPDRLFHSIQEAWQSASQLNTADVKELIPEFFYLPEFLMNQNRYDLGVRATGVQLNDVVLPKWAHNDPMRFIHLHRQALECEYVSQNLHKWIDLIFGYKQRGRAAIEATNVFHYLSYENAVDIDAITDPVQKAATIGIINHFGQTPRQLFFKPHKPRSTTPAEPLSIQSTPDMLIQSILPLRDLFNGDRMFTTTSGTLALNAASASGSVALQNTGTYNANTGSPTAGAIFSNNATPEHFMPIVYLRPANPSDKVVSGNMPVIACSAGHLVSPGASGRVVEWGHLDGSLRLRSSLSETDKLLAVWESPHNGPITVVTWVDETTLVTGGADGLVMVWTVVVPSQRSATYDLRPRATLRGHCAPVSCFAISRGYMLLASGAQDGSIFLWDLYRFTYVRDLAGHDGPIQALAISDVNGNIATATASVLRLWTINGELLAEVLCEFVTEGGGVGFDQSSVKKSPPAYRPLAIPPSPFPQMVPSQGLLSLAFVEAPTGVGGEIDVTIASGHADGRICIWSLLWQTPSQPDVRGWILQLRRVLQHHLWIPPAVVDSKSNTSTSVSTSIPVTLSNVHLGNSTSGVMVGGSMFFSPVNPNSQTASQATAQSPKEVNPSASSQPGPSNASLLHRMSLAVSSVGGIVTNAATAFNTNNAVDASVNVPPTISVTPAASAPMVTLASQTSGGPQVGPIERVAITCLIAASDQRRLYVGDAYGRVFAWSLPDSDEKHWVRDATVDSCMACGGRFVLVDRKHHCRACGGIYCQTCSRFEMDFPSASQRTIRMCQRCFTQLKTV